MLFRSKILGATAKNLFWGRIKFFAVGTLQDTWFLVLVTLIISGLLVSSIPLLALKFKSKSWQDNKDKFIFLIIVLILITYTVLPYVFYIPKIPILDYLVIPFIILLYVVYSLLCPYFLDSKK